MTWNVYLWTKGPSQYGGKLDILGTVEGDEWGAAHRAATEMWPDYAPRQPNYPRGRLTLKLACKDITQPSPQG